MTKRKTNQRQESISNISHVNTYDSVWRWLRNLKEYRDDYQGQEKGKLKEKDLKEKWGFSPLADPSDPDDIRSMNLFVYLDSFKKKSHPIRGNIKLLSPHESFLHFSRTKKGLFDPNDNKVEKIRKPKKICLEITEFRDVDILCKEFKALVRMIYELSEITPQRPSPDKEIALYKIKMYHKLGYPKNKIEDLMSKSPNKNDPDATDYEESRGRLIRKYFKELGI